MSKRVQKVLLVLFGHEKYDFICNRVGYLIGLKSSTAYVIFHYYVKIKVGTHGFFASFQDFLVCYNTC